MTRKPRLPESVDNAVYPLLERDGATTVALFSDWGTGYYHSRYIARHIRTLRAAQAIHLGDVYYTGTQQELETQYMPLLETLLREMPVYCMNANHEMDSHPGFRTWPISPRSDGSARPLDLPTSRRKRATSV